MKSSEQTNEISAALAKAQGAINNPSKKAENPHFKSQYADLSGGINAIREGLSSNGIAFIQATRIDGDMLVLDTRLTHSSGQWIECEYPVCKFPVQPQIMGSAMTYARRYSLFSLVGIAGEDDDGNAADKAEISAPPPKAKAAMAQLKVLSEHLDRTGRSAEKLLKHYGAPSFNDLTATDAAAAIEMLSGIPDKAKAA